MSAATCKIQLYLKTPNTVDSANFYLNDPKYPLYSISSDKTKAKVFESLLDLSGDSVLYWMLSTFNPQKQRYELKKQANRNDSNKGSIYLNIENSERSEKIFAWLTDDQYYTINKLEFISGRGKDIFEDITYKVVNEIPVPISGKYTRFLNGKLFEERIFNVSFIELKGNKIPNSLFTMKIPQNAVVQNMDTGQILVDTSVIKDYLDSIPLWKHPRFWFLGCINLVILGVIIYLSRNNIRLLLKMKK